LSPGDVAKTLHRGGPTERDTNTAAAFKPGDKVRAKNINPPTHTRLPRYVRGRVGTIERIVSFLAVGIFMLIVGYFSPVPPRARESA